ncbi:hypothetical protein [Rhizobium esperanzae]|uniref:Uncharacterized protein n=1 Tax=Rhizobium esperanzae TaxID=1967781 RepID=A0A7W6R894_9HYPH|nr:hypothetical protein [Rhizobium esperanzae]MBB4238681.1 hypothetical protein [Rhizobium esperanzae]
MIPTISGGNTGRTQGDIDDQRKRLAYAMLQQGMDTSPVQSPWEGVARLAESGLGGLAVRQQRQAQQAGAGSRCRRSDRPAIRTSAGLSRLPVAVLRWRTDAPDWRLN